MNTKCIIIIISSSSSIDYFILSQILQPLKNITIKLINKTFKMYNIKIYYFITISFKSCTF